MNRRFLVVICNLRCIFVLVSEIKLTTVSTTVKNKFWLQNPINLLGIPSVIARKRPREYTISQQN